MLNMLIHNIHNTHIHIQVYIYAYTYIHMYVHAHKYILYDFLYFYPISTLQILLEMCYIILKNTEQFR